MFKRLSVSFVSVMVLLIVLACIGWAVTFLFGLTLTPVEGGPPEEIDFFVARIWIGTSILGVLFGFWKVIDFGIYMYKICPGDEDKNAHY